MIITHEHVQIVAQCPNVESQARVFEAEARYCSMRLLHHRPETFDCTLSLAPSAMEVTVCIKDASILQLLFLQDLRSSTTEAAPQSHSCLKGV